MSGPRFAARVELSIGDATGEDVLARVGLWAAVLTTLAILAFDASFLIGFAGPDMQVPAVAASLCIAPPFIALAMALYLRTAPAYRVLSGIGVAYATIYATLISLNYGLQLTVVRQDPQAFTWLSMAASPGSAFWAFEIFGYGFMSLAAVFLIPAIHGMRFQRTIAWLFGINLATFVAGLAAYVLFHDPVHPLILAGLGVWSLVFPTATALVGWQFWHELKSTAAPTK